jgi:hypothetical protein
LINYYEELHTTKEIVPLGKSGAMRKIHTFITHILWDEEEPGVLRGSLRRVANDQVRTFENQEALVVLLQEMMRIPGDEPPADYAHVAPSDG